jgi:hypothetical protein
LSVLSSKAVRRWQAGVPTNVWLGASGYAVRIEHADPPGGRIAARLAVHHMWNGVELSRHGESVDIPKVPRVSASKAATTGR